MNVRLRQRLGLFTLGWCVSYLLFLTSVVATPKKLKFKLPPPPQRAIVGHRSAAASRCIDCPALSAPLTAIVPIYPAGVWGLTAQTHPTFWFYLPYQPEEIVDLSFTIQAESDPTNPQIIYQNLTLKPIANSRLISVTLPSSIAPLVANQPHHWFLKLNTQQTIGKRPIFVDGWVQRAVLAPDIIDRIQQSPPIDRAFIYAEQGLLYDAVAIMARQRVVKPQDLEISQAWQDLLNAIGLGKLIS